MSDKSITKEMRKKCWKAKDEYFQCLKENEDDNISKKVCKKFLDAYQEYCPKKWVQHFSDRELRKLYQLKIEKYGDPVDKLESLPED